MPRKVKSKRLSGVTSQGSRERDAINFSVHENAEKSASSECDNNNQPKGVYSMSTYIVPGRVTQKASDPDSPVKYMNLPVDINTTHPVRNGMIVLVVNQVYGVSKSLEFTFKSGGYEVFKEHNQGLNIKQETYLTNSFHRMIGGTIIWIKGTNLYNLQQMNLTEVGLIQTADGLAAAHRYANHFGMIFCGLH